MDLVANSMFVRELRPALTGGETNLATYLVGPRGPEYRRDDANGGIVRWYVYDALGSVLEEVDGNGNVTSTRKYDVYGATRTSTGTTTSKHRFVGALGHPSEDETGLIYMQARYMDPAAGRFISEDPGKNGENWFAYCDNSPINARDATGRDTTWANLFNALMLLFCTAAGAAAGYWLMTLFIEHLNPGYRGGRFMFSAIASGFGTTLAAFVIALLADPSGWAKGSRDLTVVYSRLVQVVQRGALASGGVYGAAFLIGFICGAAAAVDQYYESDYYQDG